MLTPFASPFRRVDIIYVNRTSPLAAAISALLTQSLKGTLGIDNGFKKYFYTLPALSLPVFLHIETSFGTQKPLFQPPTP